MNEKKPIDVDEINQSIIEHIITALNKFSFGEYKEETDYPVVLTKVKIESAGAKKEYVFSTRLSKHPNGILKHLNIGVRNFGE